MKVRMLSRGDVASLLTIDDCIDAMERAFAMLCGCGTQGRVQLQAAAGVGVDFDLA